MGRQRFDAKVDRTFDAKAETVQRVEVITGFGRRRRWPSEVKARVVMESLEKGAIVSEVARRHGLRPQQLFGWRKQARKQETRSEGSAPVWNINEESSVAGARRCWDDESDVGSVRNLAASAPERSLKVGNTPNVIGEIARNTQVEAHIGSWLECPNAARASWLITG
jgi:transposase-like protein